MFSKEKSVIMTGTFTDTYESRLLNRIGRWYKPWFYKHVETYLTKGVQGIEYIPTMDFLFRHNKPFFLVNSHLVAVWKQCLFQIFIWLAPTF